MPTRPPLRRPQAKKIQKKKVVKKFAIDCSQPVDDGIMDAASFVRAPPHPLAGAGRGLSSSAPPPAGLIVPSRRRTSPRAR